MLTGAELASILATAGAGTHDDLTEFLYWQCYVKPFSEPYPEPPPAENLTPVLRAAHAGQPCREFGWQVTQAFESGRILARKGGDIRGFEAGHYLNLDDPVGLPKKDHRVAICRPKDSTAIQAGYYHIFGEAIGEDGESLRLVRFYWNVRAEGAPRLVNIITRALGRFQIPYQMKLPQWRKAYCRRDTAVVYMNRRYYRIATAIFADVHAQIVEHLGSGTPLFTKPLAHGLGLAENTGESFGKTRCRMVAEALLKAREAGLLTEEQLADAVIREFRQQGVDPELPYLNPGSYDRYEWP
ncbi:MAG: T3SS effector HopA1 family protein [Candidatus Solibacter sp.]